jgi:hypothetical protein
MFMTRLISNKDINYLNAEYSGANSAEIFQDHDFLGNQGINALVFSMFSLY